MPCNHVYMIKVEWIEGELMFGVLNHNMMNVVAVSSYMQKCWHYWWWMHVCVDDHVDDLFVVVNFIHAKCWCYWWWMHVCVDGYLMMNWWIISMILLVEHDDDC